MRARPPKPIIWKMSVSQAENYMALAGRYQRLELTEEEYAEALMTLPNYPLPGLPGPGQTLRIVVDPRTISHGRSLIETPKGIH